MKCQQKKCDEQARLFYYWPGHPKALYVCLECGAKAQALANFMGFVLPLFSIPYRDGGALPVDDPKADRTDPAIEPVPENPERSEREGVTQTERDALLEDG